MTSCHKCVPGSFSSSSGSSACNLCGAGQYALSDTSTSCIHCSHGYYQNVVGSANCKLCGLDRPLSDEGSQSADNCLACPSGTQWNLISCATPPAVQQAVQVEFTLKITIEVYQKNTQAFEVQFIVDICSALPGVVNCKTRIQVVKVYSKTTPQGKGVSIMSGSLGVVFNILPDSSDATNTPVVIFRNLNAAVQDDSSPIYSGAYTSAADKTAPLQIAVVAQCSDGSYSNPCPTEVTSSPVGIIMGVLGAVLFVVAIAVLYKYCNSKAAANKHAQAELNMINVGAQANAS